MTLKARAAAARAARHRLKELSQITHRPRRRRLQVMKRGRSSRGQSRFFYFEGLRQLLATSGQSTPALGHGLENRAAFPHGNILRHYLVHIGGARSRPAL